MKSKCRALHQKVSDGSSARLLGNPYTPAGRHLLRTQRRAARLSKGFVQMNCPKTTKLHAKC